jgi:hypothetical protein
MSTGSALREALFAHVFYATPAMAVSEVAYYHS